MIGTATKNVFVLHDDFYLPNLQRNRKLWVYLPESYQQGDRQYPVIYMQDGQNLFDELNAFGREWGIDETLDAHGGEIIVVGIDNGEDHRMAEYMLYDHPEHGAAEGAKYLKDITEVIKPFVDDVLRTKPEKEHTSIAGSSMGGLISFYGGLYFPDIFGAVGIFSPALWIDAPKIFNETMEVIAHKADAEPDYTQRWYFYAGAQESETMVAEVAAMVKIMRSNELLDVTYQIDGGGIHDEAVWKNYFTEFYKWIVGKKSAEVIEEGSDLKI
jgi:predicted alpha/beta superfamily hydrolase